MAVEAQLCPQCGAAIQFKPGQSQTVCAHCGTMVTLSMPAGGAAEKEPPARPGGHAAAPAQHLPPGELPTAKPAWGEPAAQGGKHAPAGFEQVTDLGHVSAVHEGQGLRLFGLGTPRASVVVRYHRGLAFRTHGPEVAVWRWDEIAAIQSSLYDHYSRRAQTDEYTLTRNNGEKLIVDTGLKELEDLMTAVKEAVFRLIGPPLEQRYQQGEALAFGPVTVQRKDGLALAGQRYAWNAIQNVELNQGELRVTLRAGQTLKLYASEIPNVELMCPLIGVKLGYRALERAA